MARNDRRSRALLRGLRRQARRGNLTAREQRDLLDQEELFRQARRENAPLTTAAVLAGAGLLGTPGGRAALGELTGMDRESRQDRRIQRLIDKGDLNALRLQQELQELEMIDEALAADKEETPTETVNETTAVEEKAVPMEDVAESSDREIDEAATEEPMEGFFLLPSGAMSSQPAPGALFVPPGTQEEQDNYIRTGGGADMDPESSNLEGLIGPSIADRDAYLDARLEALRDTETEGSATTRGGYGLYESEDIYRDPINYADTDSIDQALDNEAYFRTLYVDPAVNRRQAVNFPTEEMRQARDQYNVDNPPVGGFLDRLSGMELEEGEELTGRERRQGRRDSRLSLIHI